MAYLATHETFHHILLGALTGFVAYLVALEAELGITFERVVGVFATKNAVQTASFVRTLLRHMAKAFAITTFNCWVFVDVISAHLTLHLGKHVVLFLQDVFLVLIHRLIFLLHC